MRWSLFSAVTLAALAACDDSNGGASSALSDAPAHVWIADVEPGGAPSARAALVSAGLEPLAPLPGGRMLAYARDGAVASALPVDGVARWRPWTARDRIARDLAVAPAGPRGRVPIVVHGVPGADPAALADDLRAAGHEVVTAGVAGDWPRVVARLEPSAVAA